MKSQQQNPSNGWLMISGAFGGAAGWVSAFTLDNVKSRIQSDSFVNPKYPSLWKIPQ